MSVRNTVNAVTLTSIAATSFTGSYQAINSSGLSNACFLVRIINNTNKDITISYDGVNDHDFLPTLTNLQLPLQSNSQPNNSIALMPKGTVVWVKGAMGTGSAYLAAYYQQSVV